MNKALKILAWVVILIPAIYLLVIWKKIPDIVPAHYNLKGEIDRFGNKSELWMLTGIITVVNLGVFLLLTNAHRLDPRRYAADNKDRLLRMAFAVSLFMSALLCFLIYNSIFPTGLEMMRLIFAAVGLLFSLIGNYMHTIKPNYIAGIRLSWTLKNEENWRKTHLLGGKLFFAGGLLISVTCLFLPLMPALIISFAILLAVTIIPMVYSYQLYKKRKV